MGGQWLSETPLPVSDLLSSFLPSPQVKKPSAKAATTKKKSPATKPAARKKLATPKKAAGPKQADTPRQPAAHHRIQEKAKAAAMEGERDERSQSPLPQAAPEGLLAAATHSAPQVRFSFHQDTTLYPPQHEPAPIDCYRTP
jgi:hypothetical protein